MIVYSDRLNSTVDMKVKVTSLAVEAESISLAVTRITVKYAVWIHRDREEGEGVVWMARVTDQLR